MPTRSFASRLMEQRKTLGLSQKQAAADLGVSQALLSHYENGIREPGLAFLAKAAEYYGVSCDYLLGRTNNTIELHASTHIANIPEDADLTSNTITRASLMTAAQLKSDEISYQLMMNYYSLANYFAVYTGVKRGVLPPTWLGPNSLNDQQFTFLVHSLSGELSKLAEEPTFTPGAESQQLPASVSTITSWVNDYLNMKIAEVL